MNWYLTALKKYAVFSGRARRKEFWFFYLFQVIIFALLVTLSLKVSEPLGILAGIYFWGTILPTIAVQVRRLHDGGHSGLCVLLSFVPIIGTIILLIFFTQDSQSGDNEYGPNPKSVEA